MYGMQTLQEKKCPHHGYIFVLLDCQSSISSVPLPLGGTGKKKTISRKSLFSRLEPAAHFQAACIRNAFSKLL